MISSSASTRRGLLLLVLATAAGGACTSQTHPTTPTVDMSGSVTVDGAPVADGAVQFVPKDGSLPPVSAVVKGGRYSGVRVPIGPATALVSGYQETGRTVQQFSSTVPERVNVIPAKYVDGIAVTISGDKPDRDFVLSSK